MAELAESVMGDAVLKTVLVLLILKVIAAAFTKEPLLPIPYKLAVPPVGNEMAEEVATVNGLLPDMAPKILAFSV